MQISLEGKVAIVTGVSGHGQVDQAVAKALAENGARLAICARKRSNVEARAKELRDAGARVFAMAGSLSDEGQVQGLIDGTVPPALPAKSLRSPAGDCSAQAVRERACASNRRSVSRWNGTTRRPRYLHEVR